MHSIGIPSASFTDVEVLFSLQTFLSGATNIFIYILVNGLHVNTCSLKLMVFILITILYRQHCWCIFKSWFVYMKNDVKLLKIYIVWEYNFLWNVQEYFGCISHNSKFQLSSIESRSQMRCQDNVHKKIGKMS